MKDINAPIRTAWFNLLDGELTVDAIPVPVADEILNVDETANYYVILSSQFSTDAGTKTSYDRDATIEIQIFSKTESVTKNIVDSIADQIFTLVYNTPTTYNIVTPSTWQFLDIKLSQDRYQNALSSTANVIRRILQFSFRVVQN